MGSQKEKFIWLTVLEAPGHAATCSSPLGDSPSRWHCVCGLLGMTGSQSEGEAPWKAPSWLHLLKISALTLSHWGPGSQPTTYGWTLKHIQTTASLPKMYYCHPLADQKLVKPSTMNSMILSQKSEPKVLTGLSLGKFALELI